MWVWIVVLLVVAGGLALWVGSKKQGDNEGAMTDSKEPGVSETPTPPTPSEPSEPSESSESSEPSEPSELSESIETPSEETKDEDRPASM